MSTRFGAFIWHICLRETSASTFEHVKNLKSSLFIRRRAGSCDCSSAQVHLCSLEILVHRYPRSRFVIISIFLKLRLQIGRSSPSYINTLAFFDALTTPKVFMIVAKSVIINLIEYCEIFRTTFNSLIIESYVHWYIV